MKIMIVGINYAPEPTGIAPYTSTMAEGLERLGHEVEVVTGVPHYPRWYNYTGFEGISRTDRINGIRVHRVRHLIRSGVGFGRMLQELTFGLHAALRSWRGVDVLIAVSPALIATGLLVARARLRGAPPIAVWVQDLYSNGAAEIKGANWQSRLLMGLEGLVLRNSTGVIVIHERFRARICETLGVRADRVLVSRNWSHLASAEVREDVVELRRRLFGAAATVVLHTGNMGAKQGLDNVIAAAKLADDLGEDIVFGLVGDGSDRERLQRLAEGIERIRFVPPLSDLEYKALLAGADILLVNEKAGLREMAVPSKLTSYFSQGVPVIAATESDSTTAYEIQSAGAGMIVPPDQPRQLLDAIIHLSRDSRLSQRYAANGRRYAAEILDASRAVNRVNDWIELLVRRTTRHVDPTHSPLMTSAPAD